MRPSGSIRSFDALAGMLPEPMLLVSGDGIIHSGNAAFATAFGWTLGDIQGRKLTDLTDGAAADVLDFLRHCGATRQLLPGTLAFRLADGTVAAAQAAGGVFCPASQETPALVALRVLPKTQGTAPFIALTQKIDELTVEINRRREAEAATAASLAAQHDLRSKLEILTDASETLFAPPLLNDVLAAIGSLAVRLIPADAYALWRADQGTGEWRVVWRKNLSEGFTAAIGGWNGRAATAPIIPEPLMVSDLDSPTLLTSRRAAYAAEGIASVTIIPLMAGGQLQATVVAYFRRRMQFDDGDRRLAVALGNLGSSALQTALLYEDQLRSRRESDRAGQRTAFLARAGTVLASSLDYEETLRGVAALAVPEIADWCAVDIVTPAGELKRLAVAHVDPAKVECAAGLREPFPEDIEAAGGVHDVIRRREPFLMERMPDDRRAAAARNDPHLAMIGERGLASYMCVPLVAHGRALGAMTFALAESGRTYDQADLAFAEDVAARAALAVENAEAYEQVRRANRLKDEFLATLSHELRTPLNAVLGYVRMLRTGAIPEQKRAAALETVERNASSLAQLVEDVLDVSRIEAGKIRLNVQPVDLASLVDAALATVRPAADARGVRLESILDPLVPAVSGDPERLQQVAWNLVSNAVKFTPRDGRVQVRVERVHSHVEFVVSDTGIGIAPEFLPHVFERFRQADGRFAREYGGLGLGLAITRHLVEMHGGTVFASSEGRGRGSTFRVLLPLAILHARSSEDGAAGQGGCREDYPDYFQPLDLRVNRAGSAGFVSAAAASGSPDAAEISRSSSSSFGSPAS